MARRSPDMLTYYVCSFCNERITWGEIVRILRKDPWDWFLEQEQYGHLSCVRQVMREEVPLDFVRHRPFHPPLDEMAELVAREVSGKPCGMCGKKASKALRSVLTLQRPSGTVRAPAFDEESVPVHWRCIGRARWRP